MLYARDHFLNKNGFIFPNRGQLFLNTLADQQYKHDKLDFWTNVYDFDMTNIQKWVLREPVVSNLDEGQVNSNACCILDIDLYTINLSDLDFVSDYHLRLNQADCVSGLVAHFRVEFTQIEKPITYE